MEIIALPKLCPHTDIRDCPLYVAGHRHDIPTCMTGDWLEGCAVDRGEAFYTELAAQIKWHKREWWKWFNDRVAARQAEEQRERNTLNSNGGGKP